MEHVNYNPIKKKAIVMLFGLKSYQAQDFQVPGVFLFVLGFGFFAWHIVNLLLKKIDSRDSYHKVRARLEHAFTSISWSSFSNS